MLKVANAQSDVCWCARIAWKKFRFQFFFSECFTLASNPPVSSAYDFFFLLHLGVKPTRLVRVRLAPRVANLALDDAAIRL